jgi:hypothetical protein
MWLFVAFEKHYLLLLDVNYPKTDFPIAPTFSVYPVWDGTLQATSEVPSVDAQSGSGGAATSVSTFTERCFGNLQ